MYTIKYSSITLKYKRPNALMFLAEKDYSAREVSGEHKQRADLHRVCRRPEDVQRLQASPRVRRASGHESEGLLP